LFNEFLGGIDEVGQVTGDDLRRFIVWLRSKTVWGGIHPKQHNKLSPVTVNTYTRGVRAFWRWLQVEAIIVNNPLAGVSAPNIPRKLPRIFSEEEMVAILRVASRRLRERAMVELLVDSGIRLSEMIGLEINDIDMKRGTVRVMGKGNRERYTYISPKTALSIINYVRHERPEPAAEDKLFLSEDGYQMRQSRVQRILEIMGKKAGIKQRLSPHKLRHTYATLSLRNGNNLEYIRITLGHTDIKTTSDYYLAAADADIARAHQKYSPMANLQRRVGRNAMHGKR
jgi:integrase/recombinase XerD